MLDRFFMSDIDLLIIHKIVEFRKSWYIKHDMKWQCDIYFQINSNDSKEEINLHIYCTFLFCSHGSSVSVSAPTPTRFSILSTRS